MSIQDEQSPNQILNINFSTRILDNKSDYELGSKPQSPNKPSSLMKIDKKSGSGGLLPENPIMRQSFDSNLLLSEKNQKPGKKGGMIIEIDELPPKNLLLSGPNSKMRSHSKANNSSMMHKTRNSVDNRIPKFEVGGANVNDGKLPQIRQS